MWDIIEEGLYPAAEGGRDPMRLEAAGAGLAAEYAELDKRLAGKAYLCGEFSVADIATFIMLSAAANLGAQPDDAHANLQSWLARVGAGPSVAQELQGMQQALARALSADS